MLKVTPCYHCPPLEITSISATQIYCFPCIGSPPYHAGLASANTAPTLLETTGAAYYLSTNARTRSIGTADRGDPGCQAPIKHGSLEGAVCTYERAHEDASCPTEQDAPEPCRKRASDTPVRCAPRHRRHVPEQHGMYDQVNFLIPNI